LPLDAGQLSQLHDPKTLVIKVEISWEFRRVKYSADAGAEHHVVLVPIVLAAFVDKGQRRLHGAAEAK